MPDATKWFFDEIKFRKTPGIQTSNPETSAGIDFVIKSFDRMAVYTWRLRPTGLAIIEFNHSSHEGDFFSKKWKLSVSSRQISFN